MLTEKCQELVGVIVTQEVVSVTDLAERVGRDVSAVHRDLDILFTHSLITYETEGSRKLPKLKHEHVFVEPPV